MSNVIDLEEYRGVAGGWAASEVICVKCYERWIAVRPSQTLLKDLECSNCGHGYVIETGEEICPDDIK